MQAVSRRNVLILGGVGAAAVIAGGTGLIWSTNSGTSPGTAPRLGPDLAEPELLRSAAGILDVQLVSRPATVDIGGTAVNALTYNGSLPGPTLWVQPGDRLRVALENGLSSPTNLHTHGLHVSPLGTSDNIFVEITPGATFQYEYELGKNHPPGVYWYHPHHHGLAADQVFGGMYGAIIVEDVEPIDVSRERVLIISDTTFGSAGSIAAASPLDRMAGREGTTLMVNGQVNPRITARPGERERWRIINACTSRYLKLRLDGQHLQLLGKDSGRFETPQSVDEVSLAPGNRADLLVTVAAGTTLLRTLAVDRGGPGGMMGGNRSTSPDATLATLEVAGESVADGSPIPVQAVPRDLRAQSPSRSRTLTLAMGGAGMGAGMMGFTIDGKSFDPNRVDSTVEFGAMEEWTLRNASPMDHPFHLHVWPMQIIEQGGQTVADPVWQDVVNLPAGSETRVRIAFEDFSGTAVYHCHILDHEDNGMMGVIDVS